MDIMHPPQWAMALAGWHAVLVVVMFIINLILRAYRNL